MKKQIIFLFALCSLETMAQHAEHHTCGFEHYEKHYQNRSQKQGNSKLIFNKINNKTINSQILSTNSTFTPYNGPIYEIPVVVHIIESNSEEGFTDNKTLRLIDEQVKTWIENTNKIYAITYGNGFFPEGPGQKEGAVIPFRLVLAQRTKDLKTTTGIFRYNGDNIPGYGLYGVANGLRRG